MNENNYVDNIKKDNKGMIKLLIIILVTIVLVTGVTMAYLAFSVSNQNITGNAGTINLALTVTKVLPSGVVGADGKDDIILIDYDELPSALNSSCVDSGGEVSLCQVYEISLTNNSTDVNTRVKGSVMFNNANTPNLSWIVIDEDTYNNTSTYTSDILPSTFNYSSTEYVNFENDYLLNINNTKKYYLVLFVDGSSISETNSGTFSGKIRFEDSNGKGVTSTFN